MIHFPRTIMRPWLITGQAPVDAYWGSLPFRSPSEVHSIPVSSLRSHRPQLALGLTLRCTPLRQRFWIEAIIDAGFSIVNRFLKKISADRNRSSSVRSAAKFFTVRRQADGRFLPYSRQKAPSFPPQGIPASAGCGTRSPSFPRPRSRFAPPAQNRRR